MAYIRKPLLPPRASGKTSTLRLKVSEEFANNFLPRLCSANPGYTMGEIVEQVVTAAAKKNGFDPQEHPPVESGTTARGRRKSSTETS